MKHVLRVLLLGAGVAALALIALPGAAEACGTCECVEVTCDSSGCYCRAYVCNASLALVGENRAIFSVNQYATEPMEAGACSVWLSPGLPDFGGTGPVRAIERVSMIGEETGEPIAGYRFENNPRPSRDFAFLAAEDALLPYGMGDRWTSFFTPVTSRSRAGSPPPWSLSSSSGRGPRWSRLPASSAGTACWVPARPTRTAAWILATVTT